MAHMRHSAHLTCVSVSAPHTSPIMLIRYIWSAMLSGPLIPFLTQPVRFVSCDASHQSVEGMIPTAVSATPFCG